MSLSSISPVEVPRLWITGTADISQSTTSGTNPFQVGPDDGTHLMIGNNEIICANGTTAAVLYINILGVTNFTSINIGDTLSVTGSISTASLSASGNISAATVNGAVWNDYAEYRSYSSNDSVKPGSVVVESGDDSVKLSSRRLQPGAMIVSDTFGFSIGKLHENDLPVAVSGRVLAYSSTPTNKLNPGDPVCSGVNGTVSRMSRLEVILYPDRIIGTVSSVPNYDIWGTGNVYVDGRVWIKVK